MAWCDESPVSSTLKNWNQHRLTHCSFRKITGIHNCFFCFFLVAWPGLDYDYPFQSLERVVAFRKTEKGVLIMGWLYVNRFYKTENTEQEAREAMDSVAQHWRNVALDLGFDPERNVTTEEGDRICAVFISEELDSTMREEPGDWW